MFSGSWGLEGETEESLLKHATTPFIPQEPRPPPRTHFSPQRITEALNPRHACGQES